MGFGLLDSDVLDGIAEAVREVGGTRRLYHPEELEPEIWKMLSGLQSDAYGIAVRLGEGEHNHGLWFVRSRHELLPGMEYRGRTIDAVFPNVEDLQYQGVEEVPWREWTSRIEEVRFLGPVRPRKCDFWFKFFGYCKRFDVRKLDTSRAESLESLFDGCFSAISLDPSSFNTSNVTNIKRMFLSCDRLSSLPLGNWDMSKVDNMELAFSFLSRLEEIDISRWTMPERPPNVVDMFAGCTKVKTIYTPEGCDLGNLRGYVDCFKFCRNLVGGNGTVFDGDKIGSDMAHVDGLDGKPGYFTAK